MNNIEQSLTSAIAKAVNDVYGMEPEAGLVMVEIPKDTANGDYSTNIAMRLPKLVHKAPQEIAKAIVEKLEQSLDNVETIEIAGPGFINFRMKKTAISSIINTVLEKGAKYGQNYSGKRESVLVEYVSANPTGNLHLGHARGAVWGDCMCRLMKASGYDVLREYYINDAGHQMWVFGQSVYARYCELFGKTDYPVPEDGYHSPDIIDIAQEIKDKVGDKWLNAPEEQAIPFFKMEGYHIQLAKIEQDLHEFGCDFDSWVSEQWIVDEGRVDEVLPVFEKKGLMYEEDGAVWLRTSQFGDDKDRVLKKKDGAYTYLTPDIANHMFKYERGYTELINLWGADHHGYIPRMKAAIAALGHDPKSLDIVLIQMVRLVENGQEVKMSKRTGNAVTIRELREDIGNDATRYFFVERAVDTHMDFDLGLARSQTSDNPGSMPSTPTRASARCWRQAPEVQPRETYDLLGSEKETALLKHIAAFTDTVADAAATYAPNKICNYVQKLAQYFHSFYGAHKILGNENAELTNQRLALLQATKITLANALDLIGVSAPEKNVNTARAPPAPVVPRPPVRAGHSHPRGALPRRACRKTGACAPRPPFSFCAHKAH